MGEAKTGARSWRGAVMACGTLALAACSLLQPASPPPPWGYSPAPNSPANSPPGGRYPGAAPAYSRQYPPQSQAYTPPPSVQRPPALNTTPMAARPWFGSPQPIPPKLVRLPENRDSAPRRPAIYLAPDPASSYPTPAVPAANSPRVLQAEPGPALALDFNPNPAWQRAQIPPGSNPTPVGRVPQAAATPGFVIGSGDTVEVNVLGQPDLAAKGNVSGDGTIVVGLIGAVPVAGLTTAQAAERITRAYVDGQLLVNPQVTVTLSDFQSQQISVLGEVKAPGRFAVRTRLSLLDALALAGGIGDQGANLAYILRPEDAVVTRYEVDLDALIQAGAGQQYFELLAGDTLVVPKAEIFYIYGEVKNPASYRLKPGMTVIQALSLAGGLTDKGSEKRVEIRRQQPGGPLAIYSASLADAIGPNDVLYVRERLF